MTAKQHGRIWKWIQNNLEMYRNLKGTIYTSPVPKIIIGRLNNTRERFPTIANGCFFCRPHDSVEGRVRYSMHRLVSIGVLDSVLQAGA